MKRIAIILLTFWSSITAAKSQNSEEWLNQKETQKKYLLQQIAALQVYLGYVEKGYKVVQKGLGVIEKIKDGNFKLHNAFFNALKQINMNINNDGKTKAISIYLNSAKEEFAMFLKDSQMVESFTQIEKDYFVHIYQALVAECDKSLDELSLILSSGNLEMKDDRRLQKIDSHDPHFTIYAFY